MAWLFFLLFFFIGCLWMEEGGEGGGLYILCHVSSTKSRKV